MAEYLVKSESLVAIADEIRELSGTTGGMGLDDMATNISEANDEVTTQDDLITQISAVLTSKSTYNTIYVGSTEPTSDVGVDGDVYIVRSSG